VVAAASILAACGSTPREQLPRAAEPARSPPLTAAPAGRIVPVGPAPEGVVADRVTGVVAVGLRKANRLVLVDGATARIERRIRLPASPRHLALEAPGGPVLVPAERSDDLVRVSLPGGRLAATRVGDFPHDATAAAGGRVFVGDERGHTVTVLRGNRRIGRIRAAWQPGGLATADDGRKVAVVSVRERVLEIYDARTLRPVGRVPAGVGPTHVVSDRGNLLYVADTAGDALLVFHLRPRLELTRRLYLAGAPYGLAIDPGRRRIWVTLTRSNRLIELVGGARPHFRRDHPAVRQPNTVAVDERTGRVYVTGLSDGVLQVLAPRVRSR
jgi:DNA-binding beta-propeller fold protein YncE